MDVDVAIPQSSDAGEFVAAVQESRSLHQPWLDPPDTPERFAAYLDRAARDDQAAYLIRHRHCGSLVGFVNVNNIVRGGFQSGFLGYGAFASHAGQGFMTRGPRPCSTSSFGDLGLHRVEANIQPANRRSIKPGPAAGIRARRLLAGLSDGGRDSGVTTSAGRSAPKAGPVAAHPAADAPGRPAQRSARARRADPAAVPAAAVLHGHLAEPAFSRGDPERSRDHAHRGREAAGARRTASEPDREPGAGRQEAPGHRARLARPGRASRRRAGRAGPGAGATITSSMLPAA